VLRHTAWSIRTKIVLGTGAIALVSWLLLAGFSYAVTGLLLAASSQRMFEAASSSMSAELRGTYEPIERTTSVLAFSQLVNARDQAARLRQVPLLIEVLRQTPAAAAIQVGNDRGDYFIVRALNDALIRRFEAPAESRYGADIIDGASRRYRRWFYDRDGRLVVAQELPPSDYDPRERPWYRGAMDGPGAVATPPYVFYFMAEIGITVAHASADRRAVVATDVTLASVSRALAALRVTASMAAVLHDAQGVVAWSGAAPALVAQADGTLRRRKTEELDHPALASLASGPAPQGWLVHRTSLGLGPQASSELILAVPERELLADARRMRTRVLLVSFIVLALLVPLTWVLANRISGPLREVHEAIGRVRGGDFDFWLPEIRSRDEVGDLNLALRTMRESLKQSIQELASATAARERLESELAIARRIQMGFVPGGGRFSRTLPRVGLFACLVPARAVGGDLYEVIELPDGRIFAAVADVSDKGIHAALLMSRVVTLAKLLVPSSNDLGGLLRDLNLQLAPGNAECMFVTMFCAMVDPRTGVAKCASAGHNPPFVIRASGIAKLEVVSGPPLGLFEDATYVESVIDLGARTRLVMYTDGITEAFDEQRRQFGDERLVATLGKAGLVGSAEGLGSAILSEVSSFSGSAPQSDDITLLILDRT
jgi:sigma-B regulation protein RsbU (phosphoserine phosphatase)